MESVLYEVRDRVATLTINRPESRNALNEAVIVGLHQGVDQAKADPDVRVLVITGAGDVAFCAGADLKGGGLVRDRSEVRGPLETPAPTSEPAAARGAGFELPPDTPGALTAHHSRGDMASLFLALTELGKPTVARVNGHALAGGFGLALACDIVVASETATFGAPEINVGLWPMMISAILIRSMPPKVALELMMTGRRVSPEEGKEIGFVNQVVPASDLDAAVEGLITGLAAKSPAIMRLGRDAFYTVLDLPLRESLRHLQAMLSITTLSEDAAEGVRAFAEKRQPVWKGR